MTEEKPKVKIENISFPNTEATDAEKASIAYGLTVGKAIENEWFGRTRSSVSRYFNQFGEYHRLKLYARGEQPIGKYKNELSINGDLSYMNLDWTVVPIIPKFVDIVVNGMNDRMYKIKAEAQDASSAEKKNIFQDMVEKDMIAKDFLSLAKSQLGVDAFNIPEDELPASNEELDLYMQLKYKPGIEIAEEIAVSTILEKCYYSEIKKDLDYDLTVVGKAVLKHSFNPITGIEIDYVDPAKFVHSYTEKKDFSDCYYFGEVKQVHYTEVLKIKPDLTTEELEEIKGAGRAWFEYFPVIKQYQDDAFNNEMVSLLFFNYKTDKHFVYKKKKLNNGGERIIRKDDTFNPIGNNEDLFEKVDVRKEVWYDGVMVLGTTKVLKWELSKNLLRPDSATHKAYPNYIVVAPRMYKGVTESLVRRMIPFADQIQLTHLKLQQVMSRITPDGVFIDADGLSEVDLGNGANYNPEEALKLYFQTGSVVGRSYTGEGEFNNARVPIQELNTNSGQGKISALISTYNYNLNMIRDVTGLSEARDGSMPDPRALVGVQKLAALNSNTATRHILDGGLFMTKQLATAISLRISDILKYSDFKDEFAMQIGKYNLAILEDIKNLHIHSFGIFIELEPDEEEKEMVEKNIQIALQRDQIDLEDAIDIRMINNLKLANEMLKVKRRKKLEREQKQEEMKVQMQMQANMQSQQASSQSKMQQIQAEAQAKISIEQAKTEAMIKQLQFEAELKAQLMDKEFGINMQLKGLEVDALKNINNEKETAKDKRIDKQATAQSKLIEQRKKDLPAINFESENDNLDDLDLSQFEPR